MHRRKAAGAYGRNCVRICMLYNNMDEEMVVGQDYVVVRAEEDGVTIWGLTRGNATKFHHTEKLDNGEVYIAQFTETTSAIKINGKAKLYTKHGTINVGRE